MIPKVIHYCWFGKNDLPKEVQKCIDSWHEFCPDYEIIRWDESNYDIRKCTYMSQAYDAGKWAFVSDYARLDIVYTYGGIYLDTDVELIKPLDSLLGYNMFCGFETRDFINLGLGFGAEARHDILQQIMNVYKDLSFIKDNNEMDLTPCPRYQTEGIKKNGFVIDGTMQYREGVMVCPIDYFNPIDCQTGEINLTDNTYSIHHFSMSWKTINQRALDRKSKMLYRRCSPQLVRYILIPYRIFYKIKDVGMRGAVSLAISKIRLRKYKK